MYQEPTGSSVATIEFINESTSPMATHFYKDATECTDRTNAGGVPASSQRKLLIPAGKNLAFTVAMDPKGASAALAFGALGALLLSNQGCTPTIDFVPEVGRTYVFRMKSEANDCVYHFYATPQAGQTEASNVPLTKREWIRPMGEAGPFCTKK